jgi:hypothetical protein
LQVIGFTAYSLPKNNSETIGKEFFKKNKSLVNSQYTNSRQVSGAALFKFCMMCLQLQLYEISLLVCEFEALTSINLKITILWNVTPHSLVEAEKYISIFRRFEDKSDSTIDISVSTFWLRNA